MDCHATERTTGGALSPCKPHPPEPCRQPSLPRPAPPTRLPGRYRLRPHLSWGSSNESTPPHKPHGHPQLQAIRRLQLLLPPRHADPHALTHCCDSSPTACILGCVTQRKQYRQGIASIDNTLHATTARSNADLMKPNQNPTRYTRAKHTIILQIPTPPSRSTSTHTRPWLCCCQFRECCIPSVHMPQWPIHGSQSLATYSHRSIIDSLLNLHAVQCSAVRQRLLPPWLGMETPYRHPNAVSTPPAAPSRTPFLAVTASVLQPFPAFPLLYPVHLLAPSLVAFPHV